MAGSLPNSALLLDKRENDISNVLNTNYANDHLAHIV